jgi:hypothetical protein
VNDWIQEWRADRAALETAEARIAELEQGEAAAMALVLSHEGRIAALEKAGDALAECVYHLGYDWDLGDFPAEEAWRKLRGEAK